MKFDLSTPRGASFVSDGVKSVLVHFESGEFQVLKDHIPIVAASSKGWLKIEVNGEEKWISVHRAIFEFSNNEARVIANNCALGNSLEEAESRLEESFKTLIKKNQEEEKKFILNEKELRESILKSRAGSL